MIVPPLFKYLSIGATEAVLTNGSLRWSSPPTLNDPFDVQTALKLDATDEQVVALALDFVWNRLQSPGPAANIMGHGFNAIASSGIVLTKAQLENELRPAFQESMKRLRTHLPLFCKEIIAGLSYSKYLCLSSSRHVSTMWTHYADVHQGAVLEFQAKPGIDSAFKLARPVNYLDAAPAFANAETLARVLAGDANFELRETIDKFVYSKASDWSYENEWRIDSSAGRDPAAAFEDAPFFSSDLTSVTFGLRTSKEDMERWWFLARKLNPVVVFWATERNGMSVSFRVIR